MEVKNTKTYPTEKFFVASSNVCYFFFIWFTNQICVVYKLLYICVSLVDVIPLKEWIVLEIKTFKRNENTYNHNRWNSKQTIILVQLYEKDECRMMSSETMALESLTEQGQTISNRSIQEKRSKVAPISIFFTILQRRKIVANAISCRKVYVSDQNFCVFILYYNLTSATCRVVHNI